MFNLILGYHVPENEERHEEYLTCLRENIKNPLIGKIHIFLESKKRPPVDDSKVVYVEMNDVDVGYRVGRKKYLTREDRYRLYYTDCFRYARREFEPALGENYIIANSDIMFDDTLGEIDGVDLGNTLICLSRWDIQKNGSLTFPRWDYSHSQDSWIFTSPVNKELEERSDFSLGKPGCDSRLSWNAVFCGGMKVTNPCKQIVSRHLHLVDYRTYDPAGIESRAPTHERKEFLRVHPTDDWQLSRIGIVDNFYIEYR